MRYRSQFFSVVKKLYKVLIIPYTIFLLYLMFFGFGRNQFDDNIVRLKPIVSTIEFINHNVLWSNLKTLAINIIGNIVMFIPFGFLGWLIPNYKNLKPLILTFLSVLIIVEALQYFTRMGVFDIDDIILNSIGVWIGFLIFKKMDQLNGSNAKKNSY